MEDEKVSTSRRDQLLADSETYKEAIEEQVVELRSSAERWVKTVLIIGGTLVIAYSFVRALIDQRRVKDNPDLPARTSQGPEFGIFTRVMEQIAFFLMAIAREKLMEFLKNYGKNDANTESTEG